MKVVVNRPNVEVRTRSGYYTPQPENLGAPPVSPVSKAVAALLPVAGLDRQVGLVPIRAADPRTSTVLIVVGVAQPASVERTSGTLELRASAFRPDGGAVVAQRDETVRVVLAPSADAETAHLQVLSSVDLAPGRYQLRLARHRSSDDAVGSIFADVEVPDFAAAPVSLSGVVFDARPAPVSVASASTKALLPVVPTINRAFDAAAQVAASVRVCQRRSGSPSAVALTTSVKDAWDATVFHVSTTLAAAQFQNGRCADYRIDLPLSGFKPGPHLLTFDATLGQAVAHWDVRFTVNLSVSENRMAG